VNSNGFTILVQCTEIQVHTPTVRESIVKVNERVVSNNMELNHLKMTVKIVMHANCYKQFTRVKALIYI